MLSISPTSLVHAHSSTADSSTALPCMHADTRYWPDEASIRAWKQHSDHLAAQRMGRERWYASYTVDVAEVRRSYRCPADSS